LSPQVYVLFEDSRSSVYCRKNQPSCYELIEEVIKESYIFNDIVLILRPQVMKASSKSDIAMVWVDIWDL